jgi:hypothetical protein
MGLGTAAFLCAREAAAMVVVAGEFVTVKQIVHLNGDASSLPL